MEGVNSQKPKNQNSPEKITEVKMDHRHYTYLNNSGSLQVGSDYVSTRKLSIVGRSYAVQSPIVPSIALSATTSLGTIQKLRKQ